MNDKKKLDPDTIQVLSDEGRSARGLRTMRESLGGGRRCSSLGPGLRKRSLKRWKRQRRAKKLARQ